MSLYLCYYPLSTLIPEIKYVFTADFDQIIEVNWLIWSLQTPV